MVEYEIVPRGSVQNGDASTKSKWRNLFDQLAGGDNEAVIRGDASVLRSTRRAILISCNRLRNRNPETPFRISTRLAMQDGAEVLVVRREAV